MLEKITVGEKNLDSYRPMVMVGDQLLDEVIALGKELQGVRLCHINSTPYGGGVAELLYSCIPLLCSMGIVAEWRIIAADQPFFTITKDFHNALQGAESSLSDEGKEIYLECNRGNARDFAANYDIVIVNDPQPAALRHFCKGKGTKWVWRCHIDTSTPNQKVWQFLKPYVEEYDCAIFTIGKFVPPDLDVPQVELVPPAIDPASPKNRELPVRQCIDFLSDMGIDANRPLMTQVSRFDHWKDPFGVIAAYRLAKKEVPALQLALIGSLARDDPQGVDLLEKVEAEAENDPDLFVFYNLGDLDVNAFQRASSVAVQKSLREGFGLTVSEALWKYTMVIGGNTGGIPLQLGSELGEFLVNSVEECAEKLILLLDNRELSRDLGYKGRENVQRNFLIPRLVRDELAIVKRILNKRG